MNTNSGIVVDSSGNTMWIRKTLTETTYSPADLQTRRKYETLKHNKSKINQFTKKQKYANFNRISNQKLLQSSCDSFNLPTSSNVPLGGTWNINVNTSLLNIPLIQRNQINQIPTSGPSNWKFGIYK